MHNFRPSRPFRARRFLLETLEDRCLPAAFTPGDLVIYRVGDGSGSLVNTGNAVFLDEYTPAGSLVQSIALPTTASGGQNPLIASGTATSEGLLTLSADGRYLMLSGYATTTGGSQPVTGTNSTTVPRVVGRVDAFGSVDVSTALTDWASGNNARSAASSNGTDIWVGGAAGGVRYTTLGSNTSTQLSTTVTNIRQVNVIGGQLYESDNSGTAVRLGTVGAGLPVSSGQTITNLPGFPTSGSPYGFFFADLSASVAGLDTVYVADDSTNSIQKYSLVSGSWTATGSISASGVRGLTGVVSGSTVTLYGTTGASAASGGGTLYAFADSTGYNGTVSGTASSLATAAANTAFRGIAFAPSGTGAIGDRVFIDANADGAFDGSDSGVDGVKLNLYADTNNSGSYESGTDKKVASATTANGGKYSFTGLLAGTYFVEIDSGSSPPAGYALSGSTQPRKVTIQDTPSGSSSQFDFNKGDLSASFGLGTLTFFNSSTSTNTHFGSTASFGISPINGIDANVMKVPGTSNAQEGYRLQTGAVPNGGSTTRINRYTFVADVYVPDVSKTTPLFNTSTDNSDDADAVIRDSGSGGGVGVGSSFAGTISANTWYRITVTVDSSTGVLKLRRFINGTEAGTGIDLDKVDGRWAAALDKLSGADAGLILFGDGGTAVNTFFVSSVFFDDRVLSDTEIANLGAPDARGIVVQDDATGDFTYVNNAPVLSGANDFTSTNEDDTNNGGTLVSALISGKVSDDAGAAAGVAVTATDTSHGSWQFTTDGTNWNNVGSVSGTSALLLKSDSNTALRFVPSADFFGTVSAALTFRAWDQTSGTAGTKVDVSTNGGRTAFSSAPASASVTVNPVADTPSVSGATTDEDVQSTSGLVVSRNAADGTEVTHFKVTNVQHGALFQDDGTTPIHDGDFITFAQGNAGLRFTPAADFFGTATFKIQASLSNSDSGLGGGTFTASVTINPVADTPSVSGATTDEDVQTTSGLVVSRNAVDGGEVTHFKITNVQHGTLFQHDGLTPISDGDFITFAQASAGLRFTPAADFFGTASFDVRASTSASDSDLGGGTFTASVTVNPVADTPSVTGATTDEDVLSSSGLVVSRNPADGAEVAFFKITGITNGTLYLHDGTTAVHDGDFVAFEDANAGLTFLPASNLNDATTAFFGFDVRASLTSDDSGLAGATATATVHVNAVNDAPAFTLSQANVTVLEDSGAFAQDAFATAINAGPSVSDEDAQRLTFTLTTDNDALFSTRPAIDPTTGRLTFTVNPNVHGSATVTATLRDDGGTDHGGTDSHTDSFTITVSPVPHVPSVTGATTDEDVLSSAGLVITRNAVDDDSVAYFKITSITHGTLFKHDGTTQINGGEFITVAEGNAGLKFLPSPDYFGIGHFDVQAATTNSDAGVGADVATATITVNPVADTPSVTGASTQEDVQTTSGLVVSRNAADGDEVAYFKVTNVQHGALFQQDGTTPIHDGDFITSAQGNAGLRFTPATNFFGTASFEVQASLSANDAGLGGGVVTASITVSPAADTPSVTNASTDEDVQTTSGLVISRNAADGGEVTHFKITNVQHGTLYQNDGTTPIQDGDFITFAQASVGLRFTPSADFFGAASFDVQASLSSSDSGLGGGVVTATITVSPVADTPSVTNATTSEDTQTTSGLVVSRNAADGAEVAFFKITFIRNGALFQHDGTTPISDGEFITSAQGNAGLRFTPAADQNDATAAFDFDVQASLSDDDSGLGGGVATASVSVAAVNDEPTFSLPSPGVTVGEDSGAFSLAGFATDVVPGPAAASDESGQTLSFALSTDDDSLFSVKPAIDAATGELTFTPAPNAFGTATVTATLIDSGPGVAPDDNSFSRTFSITVTPVADTPGVTNATTNEDAQTTSGLVVSRNAADGGEVTHFKVTNVQHGTLYQNDGTTAVSPGSFVSFAEGAAGLRFTPTADFFGTASFDVQASIGSTDAGLSGNVVTATVTVNPIADTPSVTNAATNEDVKTTSGLVISRNAADTVEVTQFKVTNVQHGTLFKHDGTTAINGGEFITVAEGNAGLRFLPSADFFGAASFDVQASLSSSDSGLGGGVVTATITVSPVADTPSVTNATTNEDTQTSSGLVISRNAADGSEVTHFKITNVLNGSLFKNDGVTPIASGSFITFAEANAGLRFTPNASFFGAGSFQVQASLGASDAGLGGNVITATITVNPIADTPSVTNASTSEDTQTTSGLVISRNAADGGEVTHFKITNVQHGTLYQNDGTTAVSPGSFITVAEGNAGLRFTPSANFFGTANFDVQASIGSTDAGLGGSVAAATIIVTPVNDPPTAVNDAFSVSVAGPLDVLANDSSLPDGPETLSLVAVTQGSAGGKVTIQGGVVLYRPAPHFAGTETFSYTVSDGQLTAAATVTVTVNPPVSLLPDHTVLLGSDGTGPAVVRVLDGTSRAVVRELTPYPGFNGGVHVALGDVNGDGFDDVITATAGTVGHVLVIDGLTGATIRSFKPFGDYPSGLSVAAGDLDGDGYADVIIGNETGIAHVMAFSGRTSLPVFSQVVFEDYLGGVRVAAGDLNGDGRDDLAVVAGPGGDGHVKAFDGPSDRLIRSYLGYAGYAGEIDLTVAHLTVGSAIVTTAVNPTQGTHVKAVTDAFGDAGLSYFADSAFGGPLANTVRVEVPARAARVAAADVTGDGIDELFLTNGAGTLTKLLVQDGASQGPLDLLLAFDPLYNRGAFVAAD